MEMSVLNYCWKIYPIREGKKTNYALLLEEVVNSEVDVAVVDIGDPYRFSLQQRLFCQSRKNNLEGEDCC